MAHSWVSPPEGRARISDYRVGVQCVCIWGANQRMKESERRFRADIFFEKIQVFSVKDHFEKMKKLLSLQQHLYLLQGFPSLSGCIWGPHFFDPPTSNQAVIGQFPAIYELNESLKDEMKWKMSKWWLSLIFCKQDCSLLEDGNCSALSIIALMGFFSDDVISCLDVWEEDPAVVPLFASEKTQEGRAS